MVRMRLSLQGHLLPISSRIARHLAWLLFMGFAGPTFAVPLLPDLIVWDRQSPSFNSCYMHCGRFDTEFIDNKVLYRFNGALPNVGIGPLEIREVTHPNGTQDVYQRIFQSEGGITETLIGNFPNAAPIPPWHLWLPGIAQYNLRTVTEGNGVGPIVSSHDKTSMAVVDGVAFNTALPGAPPTAEYAEITDPILGISIGWADLYSSGLPGQWAEATGLPNGPYWLEVIADPYDRIQETNEENNINRVMVNLFIPPPQIEPGDYNQDDVVDAADYVVWRNTLGQTVPMLGTGADGDGDGVIGPADFDVWRAKFGSIPPGAGSHSGEVPEPASIATLWIALIIQMLSMLAPMRRGFGQFQNRS